MKKAYISALLYSFIIGFSFMSTKITVIYANPVTALAHRFLIGALVFVVYRIVTRTKTSMKLKDLKVLLPLSLSYPIGYFLVQAIALSKITSGEVGILFAVSPAIALLIGKFFLKEESSKVQLMGVTLSIAGVLSIFLFSGVTLSIGNLQGYIYAILAASIFAIYNTHARLTVRNYSFFEVTEMLLVIGAIFFNLLSIQYGLSNYISPFKHIDYVLAVSYIGVIASVFASLTATYALTKIKASQLTIFSNLATLISILAGVIILRESVYWYHLLSTLLIITGVVLANKEKAH